MEQRCGPFIFFSNFDSGNLARVEKIDVANAAPTAVPIDSDGEKEDCPTGTPEVKPDYAFNVWVSPDCTGTPYQNGNRSWFHFGIRGSLSSHVIRITVMNMNRQSKLYSQGYNVIAKFLPSRPVWERLRIKPSYRYSDTSFMLTYTCTFPHCCDTAYFAFCYPWSYEDSQQQQAQFESMFSYCLNPHRPETISPDSIYFYRETLCHTLQGRKVDLITVSDYSNMLPEPEPRFDPRLFPEKKERCKSFKNKRVFVLTSRVHPGETPGSFVFNGFLNFILRAGDFRAKRLRQLYVFKLIPMLNPDGVYCGHYRTDTRGVNLNRVYLDPNFDLYPSIYAVKALIVFHHVFNRVKSSSIEQLQQQTGQPTVFEQQQKAVGPSIPESPRSSTTPPPLVETPKEDPKITAVSESLAESRVFNEQFLKSERTNSDIRKCASAPSVRPPISESLTEHQLRRSGATTSNLSTSTPAEKGSGNSKIHFEIGNEGSDDDDIDFTPPFGVSEVVKYAPHLCDKSLLDIPPSMSGVVFYVDLHGHASKRGCFIYGNHLEDENVQVDNVTYAKLISLNSQHFDFEGCNFSEKNMYTKDRHDMNSSKEGSGRVALFKAIGLIHSYTLECNYNMGRTLNVLSACVGPGSGRCTPPTPPSYMPIRFTPKELEEVGRGVAIAALDMYQENPCSRLPNTEFNTLVRLKEWVRYRVLAGRAEARVYRSSLNGGGPIFTGPKNGLGGFAQPPTKHRSLSMPAAPATLRAPLNNGSNVNGKSPNKQLPNRSSIGQNQLKQLQTQQQQTTPVKQPASPTKRTLSFTNKTTSPYFSKPVIGMTTTLTTTTVMQNVQSVSEDGNSNGNSQTNNAEPASKWPSLCPENGCGGGNNNERPQTPSVISIRQPQQLLSVSKVEPTLTIQTPSSLPWTAHINGSGTPKSSQPVRTSKDAKESTNGRLTNRPRPQSRGYNFFSNSHIYPSSPTLLINGNISNISKSFGATQSATAVVQRQLSADAVSLQTRNQQQQQHGGRTTPLLSKQSEMSDVDVFVAQDSADAITEMFESSTLEISFPDYVSSTMMITDDHLVAEEEANSGGVMFPPIVQPQQQQQHDLAASRPICSINILMPFNSSPNNGNNPNNNNALPRSNHHLARRRNGGYMIQRPSVVHPRHHLHLRQAQSPPRRKK